MGWPTEVQNTKGGTGVGSCMYVSVCACVCVVVVVGAGASTELEWSEGHLDGFVGG